MYFCPQLSLPALHIPLTHHLLGPSAYCLALHSVPSFLLFDLISIPSQLQLQVSSSRPPSCHMLTASSPFITLFPLFPSVFFSLLSVPYFSSSSCLLPVFSIYVPFLTFLRFVLLISYFLIFPIDSLFLLVQYPFLSCLHIQVSPISIPDFYLIFLFILYLLLSQVPFSAHCFPLAQQTYFIFLLSSLCSSCFIIPVFFSTIFTL